MSAERWNDDITYVFSIHRVCLQIFGLWPQTQTLFTRIRWILTLITIFTILPCVMIDFIGSKQNAGMSNIESILYVGCTSVNFIKNLCIGLSQRKLATNIEAAIDDWLFAGNNKKTRMIMKKYAYQGKIITLVFLYAAGVCLSSYILVIVVINMKQIFFTDPTDVNTNTTEWLFLIPSGELSHSVTGSQYAVIVSFQIVQVILMCIAQCAIDSFYFNITLHLAGQLEVLKNNFKIFANELDTETNYRKKFVSLINRHSELTEFYQNLEDSFHFFILSQLVIMTIMIALIGLRLNICLNEKNYVEFFKSILVLNFLFIQSLMYTYGGDFLQKESEGIFYALYATSWFTLPAALMKDLHFAMMRSSISFRLTGGKFFYVNRETMMYILKTAASYVSVLRIVLRD